MSDDREPRKGQTLEGVGEPAEERTMTEPPSAVDPGLDEKAHRLQKEIAEDREALEEVQQQQQ
jgi:hypothetical protein